MDGLLFVFWLNQIALGCRPCRPCRFLLASSAALFAFWLRKARRASTVPHRFRIRTREEPYCHSYRTGY